MIGVIMSTEILYYSMFFPINMLTAVMKLEFSRNLFYSLIIKFYTKLKPGSFELKTNQETFYTDAIISVIK